MSDSYILKIVIGVLNFMKWCIESGVSRASQSILLSQKVAFLVVNRYNGRYWSDNDPHETVARIQNKLKVTTWYGIISYRLVLSYLISFVLTVRHWLNEHFPGRWVCSQGQTEQPARSPDLTSCDYFLSEWVKKDMCRSKPGIFYELNNKISQVISGIPVQFITRSVFKCVENSDGH